MGNSWIARIRSAPLPHQHMANASVGLFGLQIVWGLQSVTTSRILQSLGAETADLALLWVAAPMTGLIVQPLIGWFSDRTRSRFGSRRPFIAVGAVMSAIAMVLMGSADNLVLAVSALWLLTFSVNVAMQPMRALVADIVRRDELARAYSIQVVFIGLGAIFASCLPWLLAHLPFVNSEGSGATSSVGLAFLVGAATLLATVAWTLFRTKEPERYSTGRSGPIPALSPNLKPGLWLALGVLVALGAALMDVRREVWLLAGMLVLYGVLEGLVILRSRRRPAASTSGMHEIILCIAAMPPVIRRLSLIQFFTWFALFTVWVYAVPVLAVQHYGAPPPGSPTYQTAADWVGVLFGVQDGVAILAALVLPRLAAVIGIGRCHALSLTIGAVSFVFMTLTPDPALLTLCWAGVGIAWASILLAPYAIVAGSVAPERLGVNLGVHNIFLVLPQLVGASVLGLVVENVFHGRLAFVLPLAAGSFVVAALLSVGLERRLRGKAEYVQDLA